MHQFVQYLHNILRIALFTDCHNQIIIFCFCSAFCRAFSFFIVKLHDIIRHRCRFTISDSQISYSTHNQEESSSQTTYPHFTYVLHQNQSARGLEPQEEQLWGLTACQCHITPIKMDCGFYPKAQRLISSGSPVERTVRYCS